MSAAPSPEPDRQERILAAVLDLLSQGGIAAVSMRSVARKAEVSLGLLHYYYDDKLGLIRAALRQIAEQDVEMVTAGVSLDPQRRLRAALRKVLAPELLTTQYLSLRLQLWSL